MNNPDQIMSLIYIGRTVHSWSELSRLKDIIYCFDQNTCYYFKIRNEAVLIMSRERSYINKVCRNYVLFELAYFSDFSRNDWLYKDWLFISADFKDNWDCGLNEEVFNSGIAPDGRILYRLYLGGMALNE